MVVMPQIFTRAVVEENVEENTAKLSLNYCEILTARSLFLRNKKAAPVRERLRNNKNCCKNTKSSMPAGGSARNYLYKTHILDSFQLRGLGRISIWNPLLCVRL